MTIFDWAVLVIFLLSCIVGLLRGFIKEVLSLASWIIAIWLAFSFAPAMGDYINTLVTIPTPAFRVTAGFVVIFVGTLFVFSIVTWIIGKLLSGDAIKGTDRALGLMFGGIRAALVTVLLLVVANGLDMRDAEWRKNSTFAGYFESWVPAIEAILPEQLRPQRPNVDAVEKDTKEIADEPKAAT